ncbi:tRNA (guanine-N(7)-)-methyltransferase [Edhazardia aedis USNM 41457]|uniref:tRNA (guanine-N(7)-)-methyltransferase n=1 Tax=Edhazardia aedis (strain USNM 41457) TaxID=1003232 RepID=J9DMT9_EDHAE|nr:tRNA (guanine-N(7)-)-methyltransferase [Edhazardia aedis USNM 41457]|eukprot:EJW02657.1 tRNA (guanine-N(7)-)-methyltransferase [Edhazardia aedis USNM 41457]
MLTHLMAPRKKDYIQRAHVNPFSDRNIYIPDSPSSIDWCKYFNNPHQPKFLDLGCGYGKFLINLSKNYQNANIVGMEIRNKVAQYVIDKIKADPIIRNAVCFHTNGMVFLQNFFEKSSLEKIFILFPDPQFKKRKKKARILCTQTLDIFYYLLCDKGRLYLSTDVEELGNYMETCVLDHKGFKKIENDVLIEEITKGTDESLRAGSKVLKCFGYVFEKI